jgi:ArsR family transcriptional regulator
LELAHCSADGNYCASVGIDEMVNCQQQFAEKLGLAPSTISHHFKELRQAGLLKMRKEGKNLIVWVDAQAVDSIKNLF